MENAALYAMIARLGLDLTLVLLKNLKGARTIDEQIAALEKTKTAQEYVNEDAARRGVPSVPLPSGNT